MPEYPGYEVDEVLPFIELTTGICRRPKNIDNWITGWLSYSPFLLGPMISDYSDCEDTKPLNSGRLIVVPIIRVTTRPWEMLGMDGCWLKFGMKKNFTDPLRRNVSEKKAR